MVIVLLILFDSQQSKRQFQFSTHSFFSFVSVCDVRKVVLCCSPLFLGRRLGVSKILVDDRHGPLWMTRTLWYYNQLIIQKGHLYVGYKWGTILWINSLVLQVCSVFSSIRWSWWKGAVLGVRWKSTVCGWYLCSQGDPKHGVYFEINDIKVYKLGEEWNE